MEALVFSAWVSVDAMDGEGGRLGGGLSEVDVGGQEGLSPPTDRKSGTQFRCPKSSWII